MKIKPGSAPQGKQYTLEMVLIEVVGLDIGLEKSFIPLLGG